MTDTSLIEAVARDLCDHMTVGNDPFGVALADTMYVENMAKDAADAKRIVDEMCRIAAAHMVASYLRALGNAGPLGTALTVVARDGITMGQMDAGERALAGLDLTTATPEQIVQRVYFATVQASPPPPGSVKE